MPDIEYAVDEHVATITLNRPHRKNAFTTAMVDAWADALITASGDDLVRAVVVTGAGGAFCSGVDLEEFKGATRAPADQKRFLTDHVHRVARAVEALDKPLVAAVDGAAVGAGMDMALMCDYRVGSRTARLAEAYIRIGLVPGDGGCWLLPRIVGRSRALRMLWTGEFVDAQEALALGILDELADDCLARAHQFAAQVAAQPPVAVQMIKRAVRQGAQQDLLSALDLVSSHFGILSATADSAEAYNAFVEHRTPKFTGR
ncbi:MAG TPA: enoyl-CoA hydratase-related protein [Trebonia sp.]